MIQLSSITETIQKRFSCRTYQDKPLTQEQVDRITAMIDSQDATFLNGRTRFELIYATPEDRRSLASLGTYGTIRNPAGFIVGAVEPSRYDMEAFGYRMEEIILFATQLGLGTCWLGGFFTKSSFARKIHLQDEETLPAVASIGWIDENKTIIDQVMRRQARAHQRFPWEHLFFNQDFTTPLRSTDCGKYATALEMVRQGPSASNRQPWRVVKQGQEYHFYLCRTPGYPPGILKLADLQRVDMGIAICHFTLTAASLGLEGRWVDRNPQIPLPDERTQYILTWQGE